MILNIAVYHFCPLPTYLEFRAPLTEYCRSRGLKGKIILSPEGVNCFLAGEKNTIKEFKKYFCSLLNAPDLWFKESYSKFQPFKRMLIKIKSEIIPMGKTEINPAKYRSKALSPQELKRWYEEHKDFIILDARNNYEIEMGTFENALSINLKHFRYFEAAAKKIPEVVRNKPVVTFCTGGIRCEKAAPLLEKLGFKEVYQLEGGILNYFEKIGAAHFQGTCFVFDQREGVNPDLTPLVDRAD